MVYMKLSVLLGFYVKAGVWGTPSLAPRTPPGIAPFPPPHGGSLGTYN